MVNGIGGCLVALGVLDPPVEVLDRIVTIDRLRDWQDRSHDALGSPAFDSRRDADPRG